MDEDDRQADAALSPDPRTYQYRRGLLNGRVILITGASDGIGKALAIQSARLGAQIIVLGRNLKKLEATYDQIESIEDAPRPSIVAMDLATADADAYRSLAASVENEIGRLDGLVHNAGILGKRISIDQYDAGEWQRVIHVNLTAAFALTQVLLPILRQSEDPSLIFTSSGVGRVGRAFWGAYSVSKFGTEALAQILADENRHTPLKVNCVNPGATRTNMRLQAYPAEDRSLLKTPDQVLPAYVYLLGPDSRGVTGKSLDAQ
jgi:NAD(P)-dependent dehydrogenase (short-subunit alcohol dehydrogenase family)